MLSYRNIPITFDQGVDQKTDDKQIVNRWIEADNVLMEKSGLFQKRRTFSKTDVSAASMICETAAGVVTTVTDDTDGLCITKVYETGTKTLDGINNTAVSIGENSYSVLYANRVSTYEWKKRIRTYDFDGNIESDIPYSDSFFNPLSRPVQKWFGLSTKNHNVFLCGISKTEADRAANRSQIEVVIDGVVTVLFATGTPALMTAAGSGKANDYIYFVIYDGAYKLYCYDVANKVYVNNVTLGTISTTMTVPTSSTNPTPSVYVGQTNAYRIYNTDLTSFSTVALASTPNRITEQGVAVILSSSSTGTYNIYYPATATTKTLANISELNLSGVFNDKHFLGISPFGTYTTKELMLYDLTDTDPDRSIAALRLSGFFGLVSFSNGVSQIRANKFVVPTQQTSYICEIGAATDKKALSIQGDIVFQSGDLRVVTGEVKNSAMTGTAAKVESTLYGNRVTPYMTVINDGTVGTLPAGLYQFTAVSVYVSPNGNTVYGTPSVPVSINAALNQKIKITLYETNTLDPQKETTHSVSIFVKKPGEVTWELYSDSIQPVYQIIYYNGEASTFPKNLYTEGGILEDIPPPLTRGQFSVAKNRVWVMSAEAEEVRFSDTFFPRELPGFIEAFSLSLIQGGGEGITVREIDGKIVVFQKYCVSATFGDGPDATGANPFPELQVIARNIGAINGGSVIATNEGIFFMSTKGLWKIGRDLGVEFIGAAIEDVTGIKRACKLSDREQLWFFTDTTAAIWDNYHNLWTTASLGFGGSVLDAEVVDGKMYVITSNLGTNYLWEYGGGNDESALTCKLTSGWLSLAGIQGFQRMRGVSFLADKIADSTITVKLRYDFKSEVAETFTLTADDAVYYGNEMEFEIRPKNQKCTAMQIEISYVGSVSFSNFSLEAGMKRGFNKNIARIGGV